MTEGALDAIIKQKEEIAKDLDESLLQEQYII